ncbi:hypothetical protein [Thalassobacillus sp. C254]|uniref:hypothetical protein n=1 Tax=Thalassobacillus sp. C254 TaxID=1225341 RepID=UPI0022B63F35|nr:hypothetical protein [Thalassobacillus sp. C254]
MDEGSKCISTEESNNFYPSLFITCYRLCIEYYFRTDASITERGGSIVYIV